MKTRNGFVSNSSSSSFILSSKTAYWAASLMLHRVIADSLSDLPKKRLPKKEQKELKKEKDQHRTWERNLRNASKMQDIKAGKIGIALPSCNYETYIIKKDGLVYISTSRNHEWNFPDHIIDYQGIGADEGNDDKVHRIISESIFYNLRNGLIHSCEKWQSNGPIDKYCNTCKDKVWSFVVTREGQMLCANCYKGNLGKTPEKIVEELMESSKKNMNAFKHLEL